jgi:hypothetical protein
MTDRDAICDLLYRYCRAVDRLDHAEGYRVWHADGEADYGEVFQGTGHQFIDFVIEQHRQCTHTSHQMTNIVLEIAGERAASESYYTTAVRIARDGKPFEIRVWGRYIDTWSKRESCWGIDRRIALRDFDDFRAVSPHSNDTRCRRDSGDPSYAVLGQTG